MTQACRVTTKSEAPKGAAVVTALVILALVVSLGASISWLGQTAILRAENQRDGGQAALMAEALVDYARWVLDSDQRGAFGQDAQMDHLLEPWARPLAETRVLDLFGERVSDNQRRALQRAWISGAITDEQARFNVGNLIVGGQVDEHALTRLRSLLSRCGLDDDSVRRLSAALIDAARRTHVDDRARAAMDVIERGAVWARFHRDVLPSLLSNSEHRESVAAVLTMLPLRTPVNVNTASTHVLQAMLGLDAQRAADEVLSRRAGIPLRDVSELRRLLAQSMPSDPGVLDTRSAFFRATGVARYGRAERSFVALLERHTQGVLRLELMDSLP